MYRRDFNGNKPIGRDWFADIINKHKLKVRMKVRKPRTTDSSHGLPIYPNLIKDFIPTAPNQLWVSDITYIIIWVDESHYVFCYLSLILDSLYRGFHRLECRPDLGCRLPVRGFENGSETNRWNAGH